MANSRRIARVASMIKREVSQMLMSDIKDDRVGAGMVSVTDVDVSGDLQHAKIFVSIYGTEEARVETMAGLHAATNYVRSTLGRRIRLRRTPEILFREDRSVERGARVLSVINQISAEQAAKDAAKDAAAGTGWEEEDLTAMEPPSAEDVE
ncbi:MAG: 30S ribosome-binding factor RbfA [Cyanobacteria bacterium J06638_28]